MATRREFFVEVGKAFPVIAGASYLLSCSSDDSPTGGGGGQSDLIVSTSSVDAGHSHTASIRRDELSSNTDRTLTSSSAGGHTHLVTLTAADFATLRGGMSVTVVSSVDGGHSHRFTFRP